MSGSQSTFAIVPPAVALGLRAVPLAPLARALTVLARRMVRNHPGLIDRLGGFADSTFAIAPSDLPVILLLHPDREAMRITLHRSPPVADVRITGPLAALLGLVHGDWDGDALFFSRDLVIEGNTAAGLALRNAIDDAELDLAGEIMGLTGPFARLLKPMIGFAARRTGLPLSRAEVVL